MAMATHTPIEPFTMNDPPTQLQFRKYLKAVQDYNNTIKQQPATNIKMNNAATTATVFLNKPHTNMTIVQQLYQCMIFLQSSI